MEKQSSSNDYTKRELELLFRRLEEKIDGLREAIRETNKDTDEKIKRIEDDVAHLKDFQTKAMTVWAILVTAASFFINRFL
jgi:acetyl-CoA carboxylase alpha subunit